MFNDRVAVDVGEKPKAKSEISKHFKDSICTMTFLESLNIWNFKKLSFLTFLKINILLSFFNFMKMTLGIQRAGGRFKNFLSYGIKLYIKLDRLQIRGSCSGFPSRLTKDFHFNWVGPALKFLKNTCLHYWGRWTHPPWCSAGTRGTSHRLLCLTHSKRWHTWKHSKE